MVIFGFGRKESDQVKALNTLNNQIRELWKFLYDEKSVASNVDMTKTEVMDQIIKLQDTMNEAVRRLCGLEY